MRETILLFTILLLRLCLADTDCKLPSCLNGKAEVVNGTCTCVCDKAWAGENCNFENICATDNPCRHSGECHTRPDGQYYCDCKLGYITPNCIDRDPCALKEDHCLNGATCHRLDDIDFICACPIPFEGDHCETENLCNLDIGECLDSSNKTQCFPCSAHIVEGGCILYETTGMYECVCLPGYTGDICENTTIVEEAGFFNTTMTLPILYLDDMHPHNFIVHRINFSKNATIVLALNASSEFTFHITARQKYRPVCQDILLSWNKTITNKYNRIYTIITEDLKREFGDDDTFYVQLWPEAVPLGSGRPVEVTFDYGFYELDCIERRDMELSNNFEVSGCFARMTGQENIILLCNCEDVPFGTLMKYLNLIEYHVELFLPVDLFGGFRECRIIPWVVLGTTLLYILILAILSCSDYRSWKRPNLIVMTRLELIEEETFYLLTLVTGNPLLSSSSSNICCEVYGSCCRTQPLVLKDNKLLHTTRQDEEDNFLFSSKKDLGDVKKIRIWHDNSGDSPDWYCRKIIVKNIRSGQSWYFFVRNWLSVTDSTMIYSQEAATPEELRRHHRGTFPIVFIRQFRDRHIFLCPFLCTPRSLYVRCERWTVCITTIFIYLILLIIFHGTPAEIEPGFVMEYGAENVVRDTVVLYGFYAALVTFPCSVLLDILFRLVQQRRRIPTLLVCSKTPNQPPPPRPPLPVDPDYNRWNNLDPNRIMVEGIPKESIHPEVSFQPVTDTLIKKSDSFDAMRFQIPSTSISRTETWIGNVIQKEPPSNMVQKLPQVPDKQAYKKVLNDGVVGAVTSFKDHDESRLVYRTNNQEHPDDVIAKDIRRSFGKGPIWEETPTQYPSPTTSQTQILLSNTANEELPGKKMEETKDEAAQTTFAYIDPKTAKESGQTPDGLTKEEMKKKHRRPHVELCEVANPKNRCRCPKYFDYFLWILCILIIITCGTITIIYGLRYSYKRSLDWCFSLCWAVVFSFLGLEMGKLLISSLYILCIKLRRKNADYYDEVKARERFQLMWFVGSCNFPQRWPLHYILFFPTVIYEPLSSYRMFYLGMEEKKKLRIRKSLVDLAFFIAFTGCLVGVSVIIRNVTHFHSGKNVEQVFKIHEGDEMYSEDSIWSINSPDRFYDYMNNIFIPQFNFMQEAAMDTDNRNKPHWYEISTEKWSWLSNKVSMLLGSIRLRQQRVQEGACKIAQSGIKENFISCIGHFKDNPFLSTKDTQDYSLGWLKHRHNNSNSSLPTRPPRFPHTRMLPEFKKLRPKTEKVELSKSPWNYMHPEETQSVTYRGQFSSYDGGGYVIDLPIDMEVAVKILNELRQNSWIDQRTRVIFIEFSTYNPHVHLCNVLVIAVERSSFNSWNHSSRRLTNDFNWAGGELPVRTILLVFIMCSCLVYFFADALYSFHRTYTDLGVRGFTSSWLWIDLSIVLLGVSMVVMFFVAWEEGVQILHQIDTSSNKFINFQKAASRRLEFVHIVAFLLILCYVKLWRLMIFSNRRWYIIGLTLRLTRKLVFGFVVYFFILLIAFGSFCHVAFGLYGHEFMSFGVAVKNLIQVAKVSNAISYTALKGYHLVLGPAFYILYNFMAYFFSINVIISILTMGLQEAQDSAVRRSFQHTYANIVWSKIKEFNPRRFFLRRKNQSDKAEQAVRDAGDIQVERWSNMKSKTLKLLHRRLNTPKEKRMLEMKEYSKKMLDPSLQKIITKEEKLRRFLKDHMKIKEERLLFMKALTREYFRKKIGHDVTAADMKAYDEYNLNLIQLRYQKLEKVVEDLDRILDAELNQENIPSNNNNDNL